jgi:hypothetical protein
VGLLARRLERRLVVLLKKLLGAAQLARLKTLLELQMRPQIVNWRYSVRCTKKVLRGKSLFMKLALMLYQGT